MGKRKLNGTSFYQCDWTGFPLKQAFCYLPSWAPSGKLQKKGSYCNWEAVVAHANHMLAKGELAADAHAKVQEHIASVIGTPAIEAAPHYEMLTHTKGTLDPYAFHTICARQHDSVTAVKITPDGDVFEVMLHPDTSSECTWRIRFDHYLHHPFTYHGPPSFFHSMRKKGQKPLERDLAVWYYNVKELPHNPVASNLFKMQLYGDVLLVQQSREHSFMPRERYLSFTKAGYDEQFNKKRKRVAEVQCMAPAAYALVKDQMQSQLNQYEATAAKGAVPPAEASMVQKQVQKVDGKSLAVKMKARPTNSSATPAPPPILLAQVA